MKRLTALFLTLALAASLGLGARAAAAARLVRAFVYQDTLYTYVDLTGTEAPITKADAEIAGQVFPASGTLETVRQAGFPVIWMLLVDNSNSMPPFREEAVDFARELAAGSGENTRFLLASFGDSFSLLAEDVPADQLAEALAAIPMDETVTRLHSSIQQALDAFETIPRTGNELRGLIVLSDAVAYDPGASVSYEELLERVNGSDVMLHSVGFGTDDAALESLASLTEASGGLHQVVGEDRTAAEAAGALAEATGDLYVTGFALSGRAPGEGREQVSVTFTSGGELLCRGTAEVDFSASGGEGEPALQETPAPETGLPPASNSAGQGNAPASDESAPDAQSGGSPAVLAVGLGAAAVLAAAVIAAVCLRRKRTSVPAAPPAAAPPPEPQGDAGIYLRLEVLRGAEAGQIRELTLSRELVAGRDPDCGIPLADSSVSRHHCRIFLANDVVYIEDLGSQNGTSVNGIRLEMARALRSGDTIQVGETVFQLKF